MLVIYAEKHSLAKEIANVLGAGRRIPCEKEPSVAHWEFTFNGEAAVLCHGTGHLANLVPAKEYGEQYAKWSLDNFPCIPDDFKKIPKEQTEICYNYVKGFFEKADWLINATDPDREGELIFGYVYETIGCTKPWKRVILEDLTDEKISYAFNNLKDSSEQLPLQMAGRARDISDWLIGCNLTLAMSMKFGGNDNLLTVGRVQTPTLALVVNREKAILNHVKTPFWKLNGVFSTPNGSFEAEYEKGNFTNENEANTLLSSCNGNKGTVMAKKVKQNKVSSPLLYNATQLQIAAGKKFGFDSIKTAKIMQSLYENKLMSYPRTSSEHLTVAMQPEVTETIKMLMKTEQYQNYSIPDEQWEAFSNRHFDDSKVGSHPAIIPTGKVPENLTDDEAKIYDLLAKSLLRVVYPKAIVEETSVVIDVNGSNFKSTGNIITQNGWYDVDALPEKKKTLPIIDEGAIYPGEYSLKLGETEPPKRYTEGDLLAAMELAGRDIEDEETRTLMKLQKKGLGTDATRAPIIKSLFDRGYLAMKGKSIIPTEKGTYLIDTLPVNDLKSAEITGDWEKRLNDVSLGTATFESFIHDIKDKTKTWYSEISGSQTIAFVSEEEKKMLCPICGKPVRKQKWGYGCSGYKEGCKFSINSEICGKKITESQVLMLITSGKTGLIKGFTGKTGNKFDAALKFNKETCKIDFEFPKSEPKKK